MGMGYGPKSGRNSERVFPNETTHRRQRTWLSETDCCARHDETTSRSSKERTLRLFCLRWIKAQTISADMQPSSSNRKSMADRSPRPLCILFETLTTSAQDILLQSNRKWFYSHAVPP